MSLQALLSVHDVEVLEIDHVSGAMMQSQSVPRVVRTLKCRVMPKGTRELKDAGAGHFAMDYIIDFPADPELNQGNCLRFDGLFMRMRGLPRNPHHLNYYWTLKVEATTLDNQHLIAGF
jgi:hypothetical protein